MYDKHQANPRGTVLHGEANCGHCQKRTQHLLQECGDGRRICSVCCECGAHRRILFTTADDHRRNLTATTTTV